MKTIVGYAVVEARSAPEIGKKINALLKRGDYRPWGQLQVLGSMLIQPVVKLKEVK